MSETIKLIIEIPKDAYGACRALKTDNDQGILTFCVVNAVANGTPLDGVKAEIETDLSGDMFDEYGNETTIHKELWEIFDNIGEEDKDE